MRALALVLASCGLAGGAGCTYRAAIGGHGRIHGDNTFGIVTAPSGGPIFSVGAGPCLRWPRVRTALTLDFALRGVSLIPFAASETLWLFHEGPARRTGDGSARTSYALKGRLAGGWNGITDRWIAEAGIGLASVLDSYRTRETLLSGPDGEYTGDFHAMSLDLIATYAPDRQGEDEVWLGAQLSFELNGLSSPPGVAGGRQKPGRYGVARTGASTDCNGGVVP
ncbi:MAG: hypothetical protein R3B06_11925 [Kofleriaceae bacterium]